MDHLHINPSNKTNALIWHVDMPQEDPRYFKSPIVYKLIYTWSLTDEYLVFISNLKCSKNNTEKKIHDNA